MANEVSLFSAGMESRPAHLQGVDVDEATRKLAGGSGGLRISIKGGVWRMLSDGEELARNEDRAMNVVIVASSPDAGRTFYEGQYVEGESTSPVCWSTNGVLPEAASSSPQAASCATCPQNTAGSGQNGSRACKYSRSLAVVLDGDIAGKVYKLQCPAQSIFGKIENGIAPLSAYSKQLVSHNVPASSVVTEMRFDTSSATPKLGFAAKRYLNAEEYAIAKNQGQTPEALEATKTTSYEQDSPVKQIAAPAVNLLPPAGAVADVVVVAQAAPVTRKRAAKPAEAAPEVKPAAVDATVAGGQTPDQMLAQMKAQMEAEMAAKLKEMTAKLAPSAAAEQEPVVFNQAALVSPAALPASAQAILEAWDDDDDA